MGCVASPSVSGSEGTDSGGSSRMSDYEPDHELYAMFLSGYNCGEESGPSAEVGDEDQYRLR